MTSSKIPLRTYVVLFVISTTISLADRTASLPDPRPVQGLVSRRVDVTPACRFGAIATWGEQGTSVGRLVWFSPSGEKLLDYTFSTDVYYASGEYMFILNSSQILIYGRGQRLTLITLTGTGNFALREYVFNSGQFVNVYLKDQVVPDLTGFYYTDALTWTITRVDFPVPPNTDANATTVMMQSAETPTGPWLDFEEVSMPASSSQEFFRLQINR